MCLNLLVCRLYLHCDERPHSVRPRLQNRLHSVICAQYHILQFRTKSRLLSLLELCLKKTYFVEPISASHCKVFAATPLVRFFWQDPMHLKNSNKKCSRSYDLC